MELKRVLLVDDDPDYLLLVEDCLRQNLPDVQVEKAHSGTEALSRDMPRMTWSFWTRTSRTQRAVTCSKRS